MKRIYLIFSVIVFLSSFCTNIKKRNEEIERKCRLGSLLQFQIQENAKGRSLTDEEIEKSLILRIAFCPPSSDRKNL
jgi:hypothetical protein